MSVQCPLLFTKQCPCVSFSGHFCLISTSECMSVSGSVCLSQWSGFCLINTSVCMSLRCPLLFNKHKCPYVSLSGHFCLISTSVRVSV